VEGFLTNYAGEIQDVSRKLRSIVRHEMPGAEEFLYYDAINYSLSSSPLDRICYIRPLEKRVTLGFLFGRRLGDPEHLLQGIGKRSRYVKVRTVEEAKSSALKDLVKAALKDGADSVAEMKMVLRKRRACLRRAASGHSRQGRVHLRTRKQRRRVARSAS
jgi:hypothetical protein